MRNPGGPTLSFEDRKTHTRIYVLHDGVSFGLPSDTCVICYKGAVEERVMTVIEKEQAVTLLAALALIERSAHSSDEWNHYFITNEEFDALMPGVEWGGGMNVSQLVTREGV